MTHIVLAAFNARYHHASLSLRYLMANLGELSSVAEILEATIEDRPADMAERILSLDPEICAFSVHLWNAAPTAAAMGLIKAVRPQVKVILGGPEVSFFDELPRWTERADHIVAGEGETVLADLCEKLLRKEEAPRLIEAAASNPMDLTLPYHLYTDEDIAHRTLYVEASRGCPHGCEFCLASLDTKVRRFPEDAILDALDSLWERGARSFKFVDRSLDTGTARLVLPFFAKRAGEGLFLHFEVVPDRLPANLVDLLRPFPPGAVQLEAGVQTFCRETARRIGRRQDAEKVEHNLRVLLGETGAHIHADLVVGLPGESRESFARGFNRLISTGVHEIQVGILKKLRGAPIARHDAEWDMRYNPAPPYEILSTSLIPYREMQGLKRFSRYFDLIHNSGAFTPLIPYILGDSPFDEFARLADWLYEKTGRTARIAQHRLAGLLFEYLTRVRGEDEEEIATHIARDFARRGQRRLPAEIREKAGVITEGSPAASTSLPRRQRNRRTS